MSELVPSLEGWTRLVRILDDSPERPREHSALSAPTGDGILAPKMHLHRECAGPVLEDPMGVNEVEWATPSGLRRRRRL